MKEPVAVVPSGNPAKSPKAAREAIAAVVSSGTPSMGSKAVRKEARIALKLAWHTRESCRKRLISSNHWPMHDYMAFEAATIEYNARREKLAGLMASGQLTQDDDRVYPKLSVKMTGAPKVRPSK
jgi:hypothetical protein